MCMSQCEQYENKQMAQLHHCYRQKRWEFKNMISVLAQIKSILTHLEPSGDNPAHLWPMETDWRLAPSDDTRRRWYRTACPWDAQVQAAASWCVRCRLSWSWRVWWGTGCRQGSLRFGCWTRQVWRCLGIGALLLWLWRGREHSLVSSHNFLAVNKENEEVIRCLGI